MEYGRGTGSSKGAAKEKAANKALEAFEKLGSRAP